MKEHARDTALLILLNLIRHASIVTSLAQSALELLQMSVASVNLITSKKEQHAILTLLTVLRTNSQLPIVVSLATQVAVHAQDHHQTNVQVALRTLLTKEFVFKVALMDSLDYQEFVQLVNTLVEIASFPKPDAQVVLTILVGTSLMIPMSTHVASYQVVVRQDPTLLEIFARIVMKVVSHVMDLAIPIVQDVD